MLWCQNSWRLYDIYWKIISRIRPITSRQFAILWIPWFMRQSRKASFCNKTTGNNIINLYCKYIQNSHSYKINYRVNELVLENVVEILKIGSDLVHWYLLWKCCQKKTTAQTHLMISQHGSDNGLVSLGNNYERSQCWPRYMSSTVEQFLVLMYQTFIYDHATNTVKWYRISKFNSLFCKESWCLLFNLPLINPWTHGSLGTLQ